MARFTPLGMRERRKSISAKSPTTKCFWCNRWLTPYFPDLAEQIGTARTIDHVIPLSKGGQDRRANRVLACYRCNQEKADTMPPKSVIKSLGLTMPEAE